MILEIKNGKNNKGFYCICKCDTCGKEFTRNYFEIKKSTHQYCSLSCSRTYYKSKEFSKKLSLAKTGIKQSMETRKKISIAKQGEKHWHWKGGKKTKFGYVLVKKPDHPYASSDGYVREHRLVMEKIIGRYLRPEEIVHHINENRADNGIKNLILFTSNSEHTKYHGKLKKNRALFQELNVCN